MKRIQLDKDIRPLSEFRANAAGFIKTLRQTKRPLVLTQRGHGAAVVLDLKEFERLLEDIEVLRDICAAERQLAAGEAVTHEDARRSVLEKIAR